MNKNNCLQNADEDFEVNLTKLVQAEEISGVATWGGSGSTRPGAQALGAQQYTFCNHFKRVFK